MNVDSGQLRALLQAVVDAAHNVLDAVGAAQDHLDTAEADEAAAAETEAVEAEPEPATSTPADVEAEPAPEGDA